MVKKSEVKSSCWCLSSVTWNCPAWWQFFPRAC